MFSPNRGTSRGPVVQHCMVGTWWELRFPADRQWQGQMGPEAWLPPAESCFPLLGQPERGLRQNWAGPP